MDKFVKRVAPLSIPRPAKIPKTAKQGSVSARERAGQYTGGVFYSDGYKMFCRSSNMVVDHIRKSVVDAHLKTKVSFV